MKSYLFYDLETSGLNKSFDQILQFAAIRTDMHLNELERYNIVVSLRPDVVPSPMASVTHRIGIEKSMEGICEYEAVRHIHALMNREGTISLGYNTLGFDDEFLRFAFHRNLLPPYTHQWANGCSRMDLLPMAVLYHLYKPEVLTWPLREDGQTTLKLEKLSEANALAEGQAHDAMVDVEATLALAKRFIAEGKMWEYVSGSFNKKEDGLRLGKLPPKHVSSAGQHTWGIMTGSRFGADAFYQAPVLAIGESVPYKNQTLWLRLDDESLINGEGEVEDRVWVIRKRLGEPNVILPPLERFVGRLSPERLARVEENLSWLKEHPDEFARIVRHHREFRYPEVPNLDADTCLYQNGFLSKAEEALCAKFHRAGPEAMAEAMQAMAPGHVRELATRILFRNYPEFSDEEVFEAFESYMARVHPQEEEPPMVDFRGDARLTPAAAMEEIARVRAEVPLDDGQVHLLDELEGYLSSNF
ncbi:exodeoxyribonuclease I [Desulfoluna spongiiphila]|uniref:Exodeoxyribonuclease I subunit C n=1 Tax=Desulfoluna spongiiphila TaxID=419481 RepID=A0A1G5DDK2_9BACT|nr:exodeoxyribonuclease I [Desulfoluna spongiiphila]SCY12637.1 Exodeoxyribonuclease I subunit C [Desulfoluna spongiiphila]VVS95201.1 exonuclease rnase t/dna polymerase iii [Desulfoluna spongiiphila]